MVGDERNIAYYLGHRDMPISYHFKIPGSPTGQSFIHIKGDNEAVQMVNMISRNKRQITVYITGGGIRRYTDAITDIVQQP